MEPWLELEVTDCARGTSSACEGASIFRLTLPLFALGEAPGTETVLRPSDFRAARALRGSRKTVNGAYRYRYAPFLVPIYDALAFGRAVTAGDERALRPRDVICLRRCQHFPIDVAVICPFSVLAAGPPLPQGEARGAGTETVLRPSDFRAARALRGSRKTVNGAYRYRYAPFLVPIYDALALLWESCHRR